MLRAKFSIVSYPCNLFAGAPFIGNRVVQIDGNHHWSATTIKPLMGDVSNISSAVNPWVTAPVWKPFDAHHPNKDLCGPSTPSHGRGTPQWQIHKA